MNCYSEQNFSFTWGEVLATHDQVLQYLEQLSPQAQDLVSKYTYSEYLQGAYSLKTPTGYADNRRDHAALLALTCVERLVTRLYVMAQAPTLCETANFQPQVVPDFVLSLIRNPSKAEAVFKTRGDHRRHFYWPAGFDLSRANFERVLSQLMSSLRSRCQLLIEQNLSDSDRPPKRAGKARSERLRIPYESISDHLVDLAIDDALKNCSGWDSGRREAAT